MIHPLRLALLAPALTVLVITAAPARAGVTLAVSPETLSVAPGATFTLELRVPEPGSPFNGYDAVVEYDPARLTFLPLSPTSLQQGPDMLDACGSTYHVFRAAGDSLSISNVLLCSDLSLTGPAHLYTLRFVASTPPAVTHVRLRRLQFYEAGTFVNPSLSRDSQVSWGVVLDVGDLAAPMAPRLGVRANPAHGEQWFDVASPRSGAQSLVVYDAAGRAVRHLESGTRPAGTRAIRWDGRDDDGRPVAPGLYLVRFDASGQSARASLVRLP
jgi:hypothetical protein